MHTNSLPAYPEVTSPESEVERRRSRDRDRNRERDRDRQSRKNNHQVYQNVAMPPPPPHHKAAKPSSPRYHTDGESADELDVDQMFERVLVVAEEEEERKRTMEREQSERNRVTGNITTNSNTVMNLVNRLNSNASSTVGERPDVNQNRPSNVGPAPRAVVPPTRQVSNNNNNADSQLGPFVVSVNVGTLGKPENNNIELSRSGMTRMSTKFRSLEEVPKDLDLLTVDEICQCLELLNMTGHVTKFRHKQVDGKLMGELRENVLQSEFNFTPFNASKLMRFVRGWRPRFT